MIEKYKLSSAFNKGRQSLEVLSICNYKFNCNIFQANINSMIKKKISFNEPVTNKNPLIEENII